MNKTVVYRFHNYSPKTQRALIPFHLQNVQIQTLFLNTRTASWIQKHVRDGNQYKLNTTHARVIWYTNPITIIHYPENSPILHIVKNGTYQYTCILYSQCTCEGVSCYWYRLRFPLKFSGKPLLYSSSNATLIQKSIQHVRANTENP